MLARHRRLIASTISLSTTITKRLSSTTLNSAFKKAFGELAQPVVVVTGCDINSVPRGITVSSLTSLSLEPPRVMFSIRTPSRALQALHKNFIVHMLRHTASHIEVAVRLSQNEKVEEDEWHADRETWDFTDNNIPTLQHGNSTRLYCTTERMIDIDKQCIIIARVDEIELASSSAPGLVYRKQNFDRSV